MAKRTNKTDHVLNLLSGSGEKKETPENLDAQLRPPVDPENTVSVIDPMDETVKLEDEIRKSLESELEKEIEVQADSIEQETAEEQINLNLGGAAEDQMEMTETEPAETEPAQETGDTPVKEEQDTTEEEFVFLNVMETLVEEKVIKYMEQFGVCTCSRCKADVAALSLTKLPAKYVVVNSTAVSPLVNYYSSKYAGQITVEVTKACIRVNEVPRHNKD